MEITADGSVALVCGGSETQGLLVATSFDGHFDFINKLEFDTPLGKVRRIAESDIFLIGSVDSLIMARYADRKMVKLGAFPGLGLGLISSIEIIKQQVFVLDHSGLELRTLTFDFDIENYETEIKIDISN